MICRFRINAEDPNDLVRIVAAHVMGFFPHGGGTEIVTRSDWRVRVLDSPEAVSAEVISCLCGEGLDKSLESSEEFLTSKRPPPPDDSAPI